MIDEISVATLQQKLKNAEDIFLLDVRQVHEHAAYNIQGHLIPLDELQHRMHEIPQDKPIIIYCRSGQRSGVATQMLQMHGFKDVKNLAGGMIAWQEQQVCSL